MFCGVVWEFLVIIVLFSWWGELFGVGVVLGWKKVCCRNCLGCSFEVVWFFIDGGLGLGYGVIGD